MSADRPPSYGLRIGETYIPQTSSIAMPVMRGDEVEGCIAVIWITRAISAREAIRQFAPPLRDAVTQIERVIENEPD